MRLDSNGNLGIGTSSPSNWYSNSARLVVNQAQNAETILGIGNTTVGASASTALRMIGGTANSYSIDRLNDANGSPWMQHDLGSGVLYRNWSMGGTEKLRLNTTGFYVYNSALELRAVNTSTRIRSINSSSEATRWTGYESLHYSGNLAGTTDYGGYPVIELFRSRGTEAAKLGIQNNDQLGSVTGWGWNALAATPAFDDVCRINFHADNTFAAADARGRIEFQTQTGTTLSTAMTIKSDGSVGIGTTSASAALHLYRATDTIQMIQDANSVLRIIASGGANYIQSAAALSSGSAAPLVFGNYFAINEWMRITTAGNVGIGTGATVNYKLQVNGSFAATTKSFVIDHPTKPDMKLRYGSLEGPENGVYIRGRLKDSNVIELPDYWTGLVDESTITVNLTAIGKSQDLWVDDIIDNTVIVGGSNVNCFYTVFAERKDVEQLVVEF